MIRRPARLRPIARGPLHEGPLEGTSLRMRGGCPRPQCVGAGLGINPARAGQVPMGRGRVSTWWNQPRACGTGSIGLYVMDVVPESTPRVRDRCHRPSGGRGRGRINPARAGQVPTVRWSGRNVWNQPRACGTGVVGCVSEACGRESTPRVRDRCVPRRGRGRWSGINPARAGQVSPRHPPDASVRRNQPRACGTGPSV